MAVLERADHRGLVDDLPARGVDDDGALLELADERLADVALGLRAERDVHAEHVRLREHLVEAVEAEVLAPRGRVRDRAARVVHDAHGERVRKLREAQPDPAEAEDRERAPGQVVRGTRAVGGLPLADAEVLLGVREEAEGGDDEVESGGRGRIVDSAGGVRYSNSYWGSVSSAMRLRTSCKIAIVLSPR